jgi:hypothetical protein
MKLDLLTSGGAGYRKYNVGVNSPDSWRSVTKFLSLFLFLILYTPDLVNVTKRG